jgi:hypothetical protein
LLFRIHYRSFFFFSFLSLSKIFFRWIKLSCLSFRLTMIRTTTTISSSINLIMINLTIWLFRKNVIVVIYTRKASEIFFSSDEVYRNEHCRTQIKMTVRIRNCTEIVIKKLQYESILSRTQLLKTTRRRLSASDVIWYWVIHL